LQGGQGSLLVVGGRDGRGERHQHVPGRARHTLSKVALPRTSESYR